ncbi:MAG TPA: protein kinase [Gemmatimonadales bacterium]|nr:protein kinase [Gemmatimonadales bacterium]
MADTANPLAEALRDRYHLERVLGRGGMAIVYLARDLRHERQVALKVLDADVATSLGPERFQREIKLAARLHHPHILSVYDSGEAGGRLWFAMPYVRGESLRDRLRRDGVLPIEEALRIARQAAQALSHAHREGVIHRDVKPENLLLTEDGATQVADFGIARAVDLQHDLQLTDSGLALGTPAYMAPEQSSGEGRVDARADQYALAATCHEMLAGAPPFTGATSHELIVRRFTLPPPSVRTSRPEVPEAIDEALRRALALQPGDRFDSIAEFGAALGAGTATPPGTPVMAARGLRHRLAPILWSVAVVVLLAGTGFFLRHGLDPRASEADAQGGLATTRLAVLPFENLGDSADAYFADGIADEVRGKLALLSGLEVIARASSSRYREAGKSPREIGRDLDVKYLLTGTVRWEKRPGRPTRVRVIPELVDARTGATRWQRSFDAAITDVFQIQGEIAGEVADALNLALAEPTRRGLTTRPTESLEAYTLFLHGKELREGEVAPEALRAAAAAFQRAVEIDTAFADAWAELAMVHLDALRLGGMLTDDAEAARRAVDRAVALAPESPDTRRARGRYAHIVQGNAAAALAEYRAALRTAPHRIDLLDAAAHAEIDLGLWKEAVANLEHSVRIDPQSAEAMGDLGTTYTRVGRHAEARTTLDRARALRPSSMSLAHARARLAAAEGDVEGIRRVYRAMEEIVGRRRVVAYVALRQDLIWALDDADQRALLELTPEDLDGGRADWAIAKAEVHRLRGHRILTRVYGDTAAAAFAELIARYGDQVDRYQLVALRGLSLAYAGRIKEALAEALRAEAEQPKGQSSQTAYVRYVVARVQVLAGRPEAALDRLETLVDVPGIMTREFLRIDPNFAPLRNHPRFRRLLGGPSASDSLPG